MYVLDILETLLICNMYMKHTKVKHSGENNLCDKDIYAISINCQERLIFSQSIMYIYTQIYCRVANEAGKAGKAGKRAFFEKRAGKAGK